MPPEDLHDVVVIGGGVAGLSAAIECFDVRLDVLLIEGSGVVGGQIGGIPHDVRNVVSAPDTNATLLEALARHAATLGERLLLDLEVTRVDLDAGIVATASKRYRTRSVLIATGSRRRELMLAPEGSFGGAVTYLAEPHFERFAGRPMVVVGGGDSAVLDALALAESGSPVTLLHRSESLTARRDLVEDLRSEGRITEMAGWALEKLVGSDRLEQLVVTHRESGGRRHLDADGLVLKLGREPRVELVRGQVDLGRSGGITVDETLHCSHERAFAAGDVVEGAYERISTAMGQGSLAARSILRHLSSPA